MKTCSNKSCKELRPKFYKNKARADGLSNYCKICHNERGYKTRKENPNYNKEWRANNPEIYQGYLKEIKENYRKDPRKWLLNNAKNRALKKNVPFDITIDDIAIPKNCPYLDIPIFIAEVRIENSPSVDRIIPELGYIKGNVEVISHRANTLKSNGSPDEHIKIANRMKKLGIK